MYSEKNTLYTVVYTECDSGTDADLAEWLDSIGVDSDVAEKVCGLTALSSVI